MFAEQIERLLQGPCYLIDTLPEQVPPNSEGRYFMIDDFFTKPEQLKKLHHLFAILILKLNCYYAMNVSFDNGLSWQDDIDPEDFIGKMEDLEDNGFVRIIFAKQDILIDIDGCDIWLTIYGDNDSFLKLIEKLCLGHGLFFRKATN